MKTQFSLPISKAIFIGTTAPTALATPPGQYYVHLICCPLCSVCNRPVSLVALAVSGMLRQSCRSVKPTTFLWCGDLRHTAVTPLPSRVWLLGSVPVINDNRISLPKADHNCRRHYPINKIVRTSVIEIYRSLSLLVFHFLL